MHGGPQNFSHVGNPKKAPHIDKKRSKMPPPHLDNFYFPGGWGSAYSCATTRAPMGLITQVYIY